MSKYPHWRTVWRNPIAFLVTCFLFFAVLIWGTDYFRNFAAEYNDDGTIAEVVSRGGSMYGKRATRTQEVRMPDGTVRVLSMTLKQWGSCPVGSIVKVKEVEGKLALSSDGCLPNEETGK